MWRCIDKPILLPHRHKHSRVRVMDRVRVSVRVRVWVRVKVRDRKRLRVRVRTRVRFRVGLALGTPLHMYHSSKTAVEIHLNSLDVAVSQLGRPKSNTANSLLLIIHSFCGCKVYLAYVTCPGY